MQQAARNVGGFIATANLAALGALDWDIETWDDSERLGDPDRRNQAGRRGD